MKRTSVEKRKERSAKNSKSKKRSNESGKHKHGKNHYDNRKM